MPFVISTYNHYPITIPDASLSGEGVMTPAQVAALNGIIAVDDDSLFVDNVAGDDSNPGTQALPIATVDKALEILTAFNRKSNKVFFINTGVDYPYVSGNDCTIGHCLMNLGSPLAFIGDFIDQVGTKTVTTADTNRTLVISTGLNLSAHQYELIWVRFLTGANAGQSRTIRQSGTVDAHTFQVNNPFSHTVAIGDTFVIEAAAVTIDAQAPLTFIRGGNIGFKGINFLCSGGLAFFDSCSPYFERCSMDLAGNGVTGNGSQMRCATGATAFAWAADGDANPFSVLAKGAGLSIIDTVGGGEFDLLGWSRLQGYVSARGINLFCSVNTFPGLLMPDFEDSIVFLNEASRLQVVGTPQLSGRFVNALAGTAASDGCINVQQNSSCVLDGVVISNTLGCGVVVQDRGSAELQNVTGGGAGATLKVGAWVRDMGHISVLQAVTLVTGTVGDMLLGGRIDASFAIQGGVVTTYSAANALDGQGNRGVTGTGTSRIETLEAINTDQ